jgi:hypothetical protein
MAERGRVNVEKARVYRGRGWSYDRIARNQNVSSSAVYYALNKEKRQSESRSGRMHTIYVQDEIWAVVAAWAAKYGTSCSAVVAQILAGGSPDTSRLKPLLDGPLLDGDELRALAEGRA